MNITSLEVLDFKRIRALRVEPSADGLTLTGDNAAGKSSVLDAIMIVLTNTGTDKPIRDGATSATVKLTIAGEDRTFELKRKFTSKGSYLDVRAEDGEKVPQAQTFLSALVGNLAFDPEEFARMNPKKQAEALRKATGLDTTELDEQRKEVFQQRTGINRQKDEAEKLLKNTPKPTIKAPVERQSASGLIEERDGLDKTIRLHQAKIDDLDGNRRCRDELAEEIGGMGEELEQMKKAIKAKTDELENTRKDIEVLTTELEEEAEGITAAEERREGIQGALASIEEANAEVDEQNRNLELHTERNERYLATLRSSTDLTEEIKKIDDAKAAIVAAAQMPVDGLEVNEDGVSVNGIPFGDLNTAERIRISTLVAMAMNPDLRVIFVREGALVNKANLSMLGEIAHQRGYQLFVEKFQEEPGEAGLHIVEGEVSHIDGEPVSPPAEEAPVAV